MFESKASSYSSVVEQIFILAVVFKRDLRCGWCIQGILKKNCLSKYFRVNIAKRKNIEANTYSIRFPCLIFSVLGIHQIRVWARQIYQWISLFTGSWTSEECFRFLLFPQPSGKYNLTIYNYMVMDELIIFLWMERYFQDFHVTLIM